MRIGIIGCGVSGQAAAIQLARDGHDVTVFERFASARPLGAGLLLQPSGQRALERLGLRDEAERWGAHVRALEGRNPKGRVVLELDYRCGEYGLGIHRGALFNLLHNALLTSGAELRLNFDVTAIESLGSNPVIASRDGERADPFDLVLDCAGAHDGLRDDLNLKVRAPVYPWGAVWAALPDRTGAFADVLSQVYDAAHTMIGILPLGRAPGAGETPHVAFFWSLKRDDYDNQKDAGVETLKQRVLAKWPAAKPIVDELKQWDDLTFATYRDVVVRPLRTGRVIVMGDAAHGTSPQLGQGANLALLDAVTLAACLRDKNLDIALARYETLRRRHVAFYSWASRAMTPAFQSDSRTIAFLRDLVLYPSGKIPGVRYLMRTTLGGTRKMPLGLFKLPE
ncbi:MAG TPA: NAD(P)/FAD-dependent oxidoreductase [Rhizomicrobium sp.]|nr:NAD(P)/FAD-dependent oxidoreductase [Rhizomicrobium sp.]